MPSLPSASSICGVSPSNPIRLSSHTHRAGGVQRLLRLLFQEVAGAGLQFLGRALVEAVDRQKLVLIDIGHFFQVGEASATSSCAIISSTSSVSMNSLVRSANSA